VGKPVTQIARIIVFATAAVAATFLLFPFVGSLSWAAAPPVLAVIGLPFILWLLVRGMPRDAGQGAAWILGAMCYPILVYGVSMTWIGSVARGDPVPQGAMAIGFMACVVALITGFGLFGHGLTIVLESQKASRSKGDSGDPVDLR
jgi:hypothetical protein